MAKPSTPFPVLFADEPERWQWPVPPFAWRHLPAPTNDVIQPCFIESVGGAIVHGEMLAFDPIDRMLTFRTSADGPAAKIPFARFCRLAMSAPLQAAPQMAGAPVERLPSAAQEREYSLYSRNHAAPLVGRTAGHVETEHGLYLFAPIEEDTSLQRVFVPRSAYERCEFGQSIEEIAAARWIAEPRVLLEAIGRQQRMPVLPLGQSMLALGLLTQEQLDRALASKNERVPLGERLVADGIITRADLQTAIAHKMGYPCVDLTRFPIDPAAARKLPLRMAVTHRSLPIHLDGNRLVIAVDRLMRMAGLQSLYALAPFQVMPVLAAKGQILLALSALSDQDLWHDRVSIQAQFFSTTR